MVLNDGKIIYTIKEMNVDLFNFCKRRYDFFGNGLVYNMFDIV